MKHMKKILTRLSAALLTCSVMFFAIGAEMIAEAAVSDTEQTVFPIKESNVNKELRNLSGERIEISVGEKSFTVDLYNNPTANDLVSQLPLTLTINNYAGYDEKVITLQTSLSMEGAPRGDNPGIPEFGYYHPGQWLAIYYGYIGYWSGKVPLGRINATVNELAALPGNSSVTIKIVSTTPHNSTVQVTSESVYEGTWERTGDLWKLKKADETYISNQWALLNGKWYLFNNQGLMTTGWQKVNNIWYYMAEDGDMMVGWQMIKGKWYYLNPIDGAMASDTITPDGYRVNKNGEWIF